MTEEFLTFHNIDYVVHGFSNPGDQSKQDDFFKVPQQLHKFIEIPYYAPISTTQIIEQLHLPEQIHGGQDIYEIDTPLIEDFSVTTNYLGPSTLALSHIKNNIDCIQHYPQAHHSYQKKIANFLNTKNPVLLGNGASELIDLVIRVHATQNSNYYVNDLQYMEYERSCQLYGCTKTRMIEKADIVCIVNPCNPTGQYIKLDLSTCKSSAIIIVDESMLFWLEDFKEKSVLQSYKNVFVIHSWTKIFSCTGLRLGTMICPQESYALLKKHQVPWNCNILALEYISKCIEDPAYLIATWKTTPPLRQSQVNRIQDEFQDWKIHGEPFLSWLWIELPTEALAEKIYTCSKKAGMPLRWGKVGYNQPTFIRVAVRSMENFEKLISAWKAALFLTELITVKLSDLRTHEHFYEKTGASLLVYLQSLDTISMPSIIIDLKTNVIIDGHHRYDALKKLGVQEVQVTGIDYLHYPGITVHPTLSITKEMVIEIGLSDSNFQPKTTQHLFYGKPIIELSNIITICAFSP